MVWYIPLDGAHGTGMNGFTLGRPSDRMKSGVDEESYAEVADEGNRIAPMTETNLKVFGMNVVVGINGYIAVLAADWPP